jgi:UPF0716 protein FxsA
MTRFLPLLFLAAAAAEIASIIWVGSLIGVFPTLLLMLLGGTIGVRLIKTAGMSLAEAIRSPVQKATPLKDIGGQAAARAVSGLLFLLPGFFSDALGLLLFLPLVRRWLGSQFRVDTYSTVRPTDDGRFGPVIDAEAVEIAGEVEVRGRKGG